MGDTSLRSKLKQAGQKLAKIYKLEPKQRAEAEPGPGETLSGGRVDALVDPQSV